jgi:drug/metabolite transporter (DMT)-like permease
VKQLGYQLVTLHNTCEPPGFIEFRSGCFDIGISLVLLDEKITLNMIIGGLILLLGIRITFYQNTFDKKHSQ